MDCGSASIEPLRERHLPDRYLRSSAWKVAGVPASDLVTRFIDQIVTSRGLTRGPIFGPAKGGRETWVGEAFSELEFVKARATVDLERVLFEVDFVDKRPLNPAGGGARE